MIFRFRRFFEWFRHSSMSYEAFYWKSVFFLRNVTFSSQPRGAIHFLTLYFEALVELFRGPRPEDKSPPTVTTSESLFEPEENDLDSIFGSGALNQPESQSEESFATPEDDVISPPETWRCREHFSPETRSHRARELLRGKSFRSQRTRLSR